MVLKKNEVLLSDISKYRMYLMGLSILMIMYCHNTLYFDNYLISKANDYFKDICSSGVDMFLLLSGVSQYFSYSKCKSIRHFYFKRIKRIIPPYIFAVVLFMIVNMIIFKIPITQYPYSYYLYRYSLVSLFFSGNFSSWFVSAICLLYLFFPFIYEIVKRIVISSKTKILILVIIIDAFVLIASFVAVNPFNRINSIFYSRIPIFIVGIFLGRKIYENEEFVFSMKKCIACSAVFLSIIFLDFHFNTINKSTVSHLLYLPFILSIVPLIIYLCKYMLLKKYFKSLLFFFGQITFEIYLVHEKTLETINAMEKIVKNNDMLCSFINNSIAVVITIVLAILMKKLLRSYESKM